jgi:medium-chain acyl-[acyl-carrier-protein] hydrolase
VELCAVQLPGRGSRLSEPPFDRLTPLVQAIKPIILRLLDKPFALFGHSMGARIAFELARLLRREENLEPAHLFISGCRAPQLPVEDRAVYGLPEPEFIDELRRLNGTPKEVLENQELMQLMIPLLRADFAVCGTYTYMPEPPLSCPISAYGGRADSEVSRESLEAWREQTASAFNLRLFPGGHFFINTNRPLPLRALSEELYHLTNAV